MSTDNIFDRACLVQLHARVWQGRKQMAESVMERVGDADWVTGRKRLVNNERLSPIQAVVGQARSLLKKRALPFPIRGLSLVSKEAISDLELELEYMKRGFWAEVEKFESVYDAALSEAREALGELFDVADYPISIRDRFGFEWRYVTMSLPGRSSVLSPTVYEREKRKFEDLMEQTREEAMLALRHEFSGLVSHLAERLQPDEEGKPRILRSSMVEKLNEFLGGFRTRNLFEDDELTRLVEHARGLVNGVDADTLRSDGVVRQHIADGMALITSEIDLAVESLPRRRIRMAA